MIVMMVKRTVFLMAALLALISCKQETENNFEINVHLDGLNRGEKVYLFQLDTAAMQPVPIDSLPYSPEKTVFTGVTNDPMPYFLAFEQHRGGVEVFVEPARIQVTGNVATIANVKVEGSASHLLYREALDGLMKVDKKERALYQEYTQAQQSKDEEKIDFIMQEYEALTKEREALAIDFTAKHPSSPVGPYLINITMMDLEYGKVAPVYEKLSPEVKSHLFGRQLGERLEMAAATAIGTKAPGFSGKNPEGETISLENSLGKITLIDFWASWCAPCRQENPNVVKLYEEYHPKGLEIVGVSLDDDPNAWKQAIAADGLSWKHLSDFKRFESEIARNYGIMAIPQTFLLDENGVIIAKGLRGAALRRKVEELLGS